MITKVSLYTATIRRFINRLKIVLFYFRLKPRIEKMKRFVSLMVSERADRFPRGKSVFVFSGKEDNLYFIILKEDPVIRVTEVFDDILHRVPESYQILPKVLLKDVLTLPQEP